MNESRWEKTLGGTTQKIQFELRQIENNIIAALPSRRLRRVLMTLKKFRDLPNVSAATLGECLYLAKSMSGDRTVSVWYVSGLGWAWRVNAHNGKFQPTYADGVLKALEFTMMQSQEDNDGN